MTFIGKLHKLSDFWGAWYSEVEERWGKPKDLSIDFLPEIDKKIWGLHKRKLVIIGGRPSQGKSTLCLNLAFSFAKQGKRVYFFSFEMSKEDCLERIFCLENEIDNYEILTGSIKNKTFIFQDKLNSFADNIKKLDFTIVEMWGRTFDEVLDIIENFPTPDVIFIDYVNMIKQTHKTKKDSIDEYVKEVRNLAIEKNFCAVMAGQINRESHKDDNTRPPRLWNLKESGCLEEHSDMVILVHFEWFYTREIEKTNDYKIIIAKNRGGRTGEFDCKFEPQFYKISEKNG